MYLIESISLSYRQVGEGGRKISREKVKLKHVGHSSFSVLNTYSLDDIVHPKAWSGQWGKKSCWAGTGKGTIEAVGHPTRQNPCRCRKNVGAVDGFVSSANINREALSFGLCSGSSLKMLDAYYTTASSRRILNKALFNELFLEDDFCQYCFIFWCLKLILQT